MSARIEFLEKQIASRRTFADETAAEFEKKPHSKAAEFFAEGDEAYLKELEHELYLEKIRRDKELLEIRLSDGPIGNGSMPLKLLAKFALPFVEAVEHAANRLHAGVVANRIDQNLSRQLDIQIAGITPGSARLQVTGNLAPDLAGNSVLQSTLEALFNLFSAGDDMFYDMIDAIGGKSAHKLANALDTALSSGAMTSFTWESPNGHHYEWGSNKEEIARFVSKIEALSEPEDFQQTLTGTVRAISDTGHFYIKTAKEDRVKINYSMKQRDLVESLHIFQDISILVITERRYDQVTHDPIDSHHLVSLI